MMFPTQGTNYFRRFNGKNENIFFDPTLYFYYIEFTVVIVNHEF